MNRFQVAEGREEEFEAAWRNRESRLDEMAGFLEFKLLRGPTNEGVTLFASHATWKDEKSFVDWTESEAFRDSHRKSNLPKGVVLSHPNLERFEVVL